MQILHRSLDELPSEVRPSNQVPFYHQISVRDQGVGFDTKFLDRIFQVFQRLHGRHQYPGSGVGLAICQRVVENHGGGITARSELAQGATFCVYLPA
ncbi:sensor histidine kinase [Spirosoma oryzicola]|uniref:sensor histidine kinase n=1 Tax=Spirosoma oryzicola TaxID=2898794 RepID=UPI001E2854E1|nr:ATP-binding protein [Spirosoma oryzicola]UHG94476.1 ATP-binding protein [Spirosoma oryzicola]